MCLILRGSLGRATRAWMILPSWMIDGSPTISHAPSRSVKRSPMRSWIAKSTWVHSRSARGCDGISFHPGSVPAPTARRRTHPVQEVHRLVQRRGITDVMLRRVVASLPRCQVVRLHRRIRVRRFSLVVGRGRRWPEARPRPGDDAESRGRRGYPADPGSSGCGGGGTRHAPTPRRARRPEVRRRARSAEPRSTGALLPYPSRRRLERSGLRESDSDTSARCRRGLRARARGGVCVDVFVERLAPRDGQTASGRG